MKPSKIVFFHIPKTAGTTLQLLFRRNEKHVRELYEQWEDQTAVLASELDTGMDGVWLGHFRFWKSFEDKKGAFYITMLREPAEQVVSLWLHIKRSKKQQHESLKDVYESFDDFLNSHVSRNMQCQMLADLRPGRAADYDFVKDAQYHLENYIDFPLVTSDFEEACILLGKKFNWKHWYFPVQNTADQSQAEEKKRLLNLYRDRILEQNQGDLELFKMAQKKQKELYQSLGNDKILKFEYFVRKQRSRLYGKLYSMFRQA